MASVKQSAALLQKKDYCSTSVEHPAPVQELGCCWRPLCLVPAVPAQHAAAHTVAPLLWHWFCQKMKLQEPAAAPLAAEAAELAAGRAARHPGVTAEGSAPSLLPCYLNYGTISPCKALHTPQR